MKLENLLDIVKVDKLVHDAVGITGNVTQSRVFGGRLVKTVYRNNGKELVKSPMIRRRTENRKVGQILGAKQAPKVAELFRHIFGLLGVFVSAFTDIPKQYFAFCTVLQRNKAQVEKGKEFIAMFQGIVIILAIIFYRYAFP